MIYKFTLLERLLLGSNKIPHPLLDSLTNVMSGRALQVAVKLGIFDVLSDVAYQTHQEIAEKCHISHNGSLILLDCNAALGYIEKKDSKYKLSDRGAYFFGKSSEHSMRKLVLFDANFAFPRLEDLEKNIKEGKAQSTDPNTLGSEDWEIFNDAMLDLADRNSKELIKKVPLPATAKRLIDIGGMHGLYAIEYCRSKSDLTADVVDLPPAKVFAERAIQKNNIQKRVTFKTGDFLKESLGSGYDAALVINIVHTLTEADNQSMIKNACNALNPGGILIIVDQIKDIAGKSEFTQLFVAALGVMLFNHTGGRTYNQQEITAWLKNAGFSDVKLRKMNTPGFGILVATK